ncbi:MAG: TIGR02186 family protein [Rhodospirillales bacterium]|nr:TIGR02186 family protein [Rhodospirillales bacterium]
MRRLRTVTTFAFCLALLMAPRMATTDLVADLSNHLVSITTGFTGADILLFGATEGEGDVVVVVRGPNATKVVRRKGRVGGIWINTAEVTFTDVPSFYAVASSRPIEQFVSDSVGARHEIGIEQVRLTASDVAPAEDLSEFREGFIRNMQRSDLYTRETAQIAFLGNRLFRTDIYFPDNAPTGIYTVAVYLLRDGEVTSAEITPLVVSKVGFSARIFDFAHRHAMAYGVLAILFAVVAGWIASAVFRKE